MIGVDRTAASTAWAAGALLLAIGLCVAAAAAVGSDQQVVIWVAGAAAVGLPAAYFVWYADPAYTLTAGIVLSPFASHWPDMGIPGAVSPDRLLLLAGIAAVLFRAPAVKDRPKLRIEAVHWVLCAAVLYVTFSAAASGNLTDKDSFLFLFESFGVLPFLVFLVAPLAFRTPRQRMVLLTGLVSLGAYIGLTALFEASSVNALVFPRYVLNQAVGVYAPGRSRGPFAEAVTNGVGLYVCAVAAGLALFSWKRTSARLAAASVGTLCLLGALLTLERSVWLGAVLGAVGTMALLSEGRRAFARILPALLIAIAIVLVAVPGLSAKISHRWSDKGTIWTRQNLNRAALNMFEARPALGFGWQTFNKEAGDYFQQSPNYPVAPKISNAPTHNLLLTYAAELGLVGTGLWVLGIGLAVVGALSVRGSPDLELWRIGLIPIAIFTAVLVNFVPPSATFTVRAVCLWAGVVWSGRYLHPDQE